MALPAEGPVIGPEQFLAWEAIQMEKHEYVAGEVFAMGGASRRMSPSPATCSRPSTKP